jgi:crotonobetainyl-CoA:carnitine CoA-transferase CaiB-like acyl-CoA transferase
VPPASSHGDVYKPLLGEHTREVLIEVLGMDEVEVEALRSRGVI